jgi:hypothetical protein
MAIISKPDTFVKGASNTITLFKTNLISNHVVSNTRFADFSVWKNVYIAYSSEEGNQKVIVTFNQQDNFQNGDFFISERARDSFVVQSIIIVDLDGEVLKINRQDLNVLDFDIQLDNNLESEEFVLLLENGSSLLLESGEFLSLE